jgi:hypothetical protein
LIGFTEGDGSFIVTSRNDLNFVVVAGVENKAILNSIKEKLGFGHVIKQNERVYRFIVRKKEEIELIV